MNKPMRAIILAAGKGSRLRPLTDSCPKPLIKINDKPLIVYHLEKLKLAGIEDVVINLHHLGQQIESYLGNGQHWGLNITYSREDILLEVGGGIRHALPLIGEDPFLVVNGDIWTDFPFEKLKVPHAGLAHLIMVDNPVHNLQGDFAIDAQGWLFKSLEQQQYTYSGISVLSPQLFENCEQKAFKLAVLLEKAMYAHQLGGEYYPGKWMDVGTIERLNQLEYDLSTSVLRQKTI
jgi:MurNAc alpha-1-phosphate uridylyltransferase